MNDLSLALTQVWENAFQFWTTPSARIQAVVIGLSIFIAWISSKRAEPKILKLLQDQTRPAWIERTIRILAQLLLPLILLLCVVCLHFCTFFSVFLIEIVSDTTIISINSDNIHYSEAYKAFLI